MQQIVIWYLLEIKKNWFMETTLHADKLKVDYILDLSHYSYYFVLRDRE